MGKTQRGQIEALGYAGQKSLGVVWKIRFLRRVETKSSTLERLIAVVK